MKKLQTIQNTVLEISIGCTRDTNTQHLHDETKVLPMDTHLKLHATQLKQMTQTQSHPLYDLNIYLNPPKNMKATIFHNNKHTYIIIIKPDITPKECRENLKHIYTTITSQYLSSKKYNKVTNTTPYEIHLSEQTLPRHMRTKLAKLRANKSLLLQSYIHAVNPETYTSRCPLHLSHTHDTNHLFNCSQPPTQHKITSLWKKPLEAAEVIQEWESKLASLRG